ncbi:MAG TPA: hypothetical protein VF529_03650 [Solirubrobacteraceae bacterium]|jgi:hypothetical protein
MTTMLFNENHSRSATPSPCADPVSVAVVVLPERCYRCGEVTKSIVGVLLPTDLTEHPDGFVEFDFLATLIAAAASNADLARFGIGPLKVRRSRPQPDGYLSNGCIHCDAIQGSFPLHEGLTEFLAEGGSYTDLIATCCAMPRAALTARLADIELS